MELTRANDHPARYGLTNELHARPFQPMDAPGRVMHIAFKQNNAADRNPESDFQHLREFINRHGGPEPAGESNHYSYEFGRFRLKWERHTEFVAYTLYAKGEKTELFRRGLGEFFPTDWLESGPGRVVAAIDLELLVLSGGQSADDVIDNVIGPHFSEDSLVVSKVLDGRGFAVGDFRIHEGGFTRFAILATEPVGARRIGRAAQRLTEIETYRTLALLALPIARKTTTRLTQIERSLSAITEQVAGTPNGENIEMASILERLSMLSSEIEAISATTAFRFSAARAYERIVHDRIEMIREERAPDRQMFREFMLRRFDPAMQTCHSVEKRIEDLARRASRIAQLLRTRVDVEMEAQNQRLLRSMDERSGLQLRLQKTVEGLSVVAISYYAVSLAGYVLAPFAKMAGMDKSTAVALAAVPIVAAVWIISHKVRKSLE